MQLLNELSLAQLLHLHMCGTIALRIFKQTNRETNEPLQVNGRLGVFGSKIGLVVHKLQRWKKWVSIYPHRSLKMNFTLSMLYFVRQLLPNEGFKACWMCFGVKIYWLIISFQLQYYRRVWLQLCKFQLRGRMIQRQSRLQWSLMVNLTISGSSLLRKAARDPTTTRKHSGSLHLWERKYSWMDFITVDPLPT